MWARDPKERRPWGFRLSESERANVLAVLRAKTKGYGNLARLAGAMGVKRRVIDGMLTQRGKRIGLGFALALARMLRMPVEVLLAGGTCPTCGRP